MKKWLIILGIVILVVFLLPLAYKELIIDNIKDRGGMVNPDYDSNVDDMQPVDGRYQAEIDGDGVLPATEAATSVGEP